MNKITLAILLLSIIVLSTSCSKEKAINTQLIGSWNWTNTDGGIGFHIHDTPASTGKNIKLTFVNDSQFVKYVNGAISSQGLYKITNKRCIHSGTDKQFIDFSNNIDLGDAMIEETITNNLFLSDEAYDGTSSKFVRN